MKLSASLDNRSHLTQQCVKCGLCLPHCPTYTLAQQEAESPRGRIAIMASLAEHPESHDSSLQAHLDSCLACRRCETACPTHVEYHSLLLQTRAQFPSRLGLKARTAKALMRYRRLLNRVLTLYRWAYNYLPQKARVLPKPTQMPAVSDTTSTLAIFSGCMADTYEHSTRTALIKILNSIGMPAAIPSQQSCCGQAAAHSGDSAEQKHLAGMNNRTFASYERVLMLASGCFSALQQALNTPVQDAGAFLLQHQESLRFRSANGLKVAVHIPCSASFFQQHKATLSLLKRIPDLLLIELSNQSCCGAAGLHMLDQPVIAAQLRQPIVDAVNGHSPALLLSQNIGCRLHLAGGLNIPVQHPIDFMAQFLYDA